LASFKCYSVSKTEINAGLSLKDLVRNNFPFWMREPGALQRCLLSP
jgi:hypothetical protein